MSVWRMVSREMLFTWSALVTFLGFTSGAAIVSNSAIGDSDGVIVKDYSKNVTVTNCTNNHDEEKTPFNETTKRKAKQILKFLETESTLSLPISIISDSEIQIPVSIVFDPIPKNIEIASSKTKSENQVEKENTKDNIFSISTELLPPKETFTYFTNITSLLEGNNSASIKSNTPRNIDLSVSSQQIVPQQNITDNKSQNMTKEVNTSYIEFEKNMELYDAITTIDDSSFDKSSPEINVSTDTFIQSYDGSDINRTSSKSEPSHTESIKISSVTTIQPADKLYTNAPLATDMITNAAVNIRSSDLEKPKTLISKMQIIVDSEINNEDEHQSKVTESNSILKIYQNTSRPCTPLDQKYPLTKVISEFDNNYGLLDLPTLPNISSIESLSMNITSNNVPANRSSIDTNYNLNENAQLLSEIVTKTSELLSNISTATLSEAYFTKMYSNETTYPLPNKNGVNNNSSVLIAIEDQLTENYNEYEIQQPEITTTSAIIVNRNDENDEIQSTESFNFITSTVNEEILSSISTIPTLNDGDILHTEFDGTTTEVNIPEPLILSSDYNNSDFLEFSNLLNGQDDLKQTQYASTTEVLLDTESTSINIATDAYTDNSNFIIGSAIEKETESNTLLSVTIDTSSTELSIRSEENSTTTFSSLSNDEEHDSTGLIGNLQIYSTEDYEVLTSSGVIEENERNVKTSLLNKCVFPQELITNNPVSITTTKLPEIISTNNNADKLDMTTIPNIFTENYLNERNEYSTISSIQNTNYADSFLRKEIKTAPIIITTPSNEKGTESDLTNGHQQSIYSNEFISTTETALNTMTTNSGEYTTENGIEEKFSTFKIQPYKNAQKSNKFDVPNNNEYLTKNTNFKTVNAMRSELSLIPARPQSMKTSYISQQRNHNKIPVTIVYDEIKEIPPKKILGTQRRFTDSKISNLQHNDEPTKKYRYVTNKERGHIKYVHTVTHSFYEGITSAPAARRTLNMRKLPDPEIENTENTNTQLNLENKIQQINHLSKNITTEFHRTPKINESRILDNSRYQKRRGNVRHRGYESDTKTTGNIYEIVNTNIPYKDKSGRVKSDMLNNMNDMISKHHTNETNQKNNVSLLGSSFNILERILDEQENNNNKKLSTENSKQFNTYKEIISPTILQNHGINSIKNVLTQEEHPTIITKSDDSERMIKEEEFKMQSEVYEMQKLTTLSPLIVHISKNAGFINNINLKHNNHMDVEKVNDEMLPIEVHNKNNIKITTTAAYSDNLEVNSNVSQVHKHEKLLENETNSEIDQTKTYNFETTKTADIMNTFINDKNYYNTKFISQQGNYLSSVYNGETPGKNSDVQGTNNFNLEQQQRIESPNVERISNSDTQSKVIPTFTIGTENSTNDEITIKVELKANSSIEEIAVTQFVSYEEVTTVESLPAVSTTSVPTMKRKRKRRPIRKFHAVSADGQDNLKIRNDSSFASRIIRSTTNRNETHKLRTRMRDPVVPIINSENKVYAHTGHFAYSYESGDGTQAFETGDLKSTDETHTGQAVQGGFSYKDKEGQQFSLEYTADENGYRPRGAHLPTPPPIPPAIARALEYLATKTTPEPPTTIQPRRSD